MKSSRSLTFAAALFALGSAQAGWNRSPYAEARPVDLAAAAIPGTSLVSSDGIGNPQSFIGGSIDEGVTLASGRSSAIIQLSSQQNVHTVAFINDGAEGKITIAGSADRKDWSVLGSSVFSASDRVAQIYFATATAKYIQVCFDSAKGGTIRSFEVFGESTDKDYNLAPKDLASGGSTINLASAMGGARAIYAFPTPAHVGELNYLHGVFKFPMSREKFRTVIYDLGSVRTVSHFATSYSQRPMRVEVIAFQGLPEKKDWRGKPTLDPAIFDAVKPVAVAEDAKGVGHLKITPDQPVSARYIALRYEPNYQQDAAAVSSPDGASQDSIAEAGSQPEFRFAKNNAAGDITVGGVEFSSKDGYAITAQVGAGHMADNTPMKSDTLVIGSNTGSSAGFSPAVGTSYYFPASTSVRGYAAGLPAPKASASKAPAATTKSSLPVAAGAFATINSATAKQPVAEGTTAPSTGTTAPYVSTSKNSSPDSILVKSFTSQFDAASSKKNNHGKNCDHCYTCNRGGRCNRCGGNDDHGGGGGGDDDDDDDDDDGDDHNDHGPPTTP